MQVALYKSKKRLFNRLVCWWLKSPYSHCELVVSTDKAGVSRCVSSSFMDGGIRTKFMQLDPDHWDIVDVPWQVNQTRVYAWAAAHEDDKYDTWGLLGHVWRRGSGDRTKRVCAEAVAEMIGLPEAWRFDPAVLYAVLTRDANK